MVQDKQAPPYAVLDREYGNISASLAFFATFALPLTHTILDVGTYRGSLPAGLMAKGYHDVRGVDVNAAAIAHGRELYPQLAERLLVYDGGRLPFPGASIDVVTAFDVLEHIPVPIDWLRDILRVLRPGGLFIFQTPNLLTNAPWETLQYRSMTCWRKEHCSLQTLFSLRRLLTRAGFVQPQIRKFNLDTPYNIQKTRRVMGAIGPVLLRAFSHVPLACFPNFWGSARKPD